jgi:Spy/CpxP family protein refolding chaperone
MRFSHLVLGCGVAVMIAGLASIASAQPGGGGPGGRGFGGMMASPMMIMRNEQIQKELEIVDDQLKELESIGEDMRESFQGLRDMDRKSGTKNSAKSTAI